MRQRSAGDRDRLVGAEFLDRVRARFELERRRHAVLHLEALAERRPGVRVQVDEAGRDDEGGDIEDDGPLQRLGGDGLDLPGGDADIAHRVQPGLGIHDPSPGQDQVVLHGLRLAGGGE